MSTHATSIGNHPSLSSGRVVLALLAGLWLAGCGNSSSNRLDIEPKALGFEATAGGSTPPAQLVKASFKGPAVLVGFAPGEPEPAWLDIAQLSNDGADSVYQFSIKTTDLPASTYRAMVRFVQGKEGGLDFKFVNLPVTYTVRSVPKPFAVSPGVLLFSASRGQSALPALGHLSVTADEAQPVGFTVTASYEGSTRGWLTLPSRGTTPQTFDVGPNTTALPAGLYSATLTFTPDNGKPAIEVPVSYSVSSTAFSVTPARLEFSALAGQSTLPTAQTVNVFAQGGPAVSYSASVSYLGTTRDWLTPPSPGTTPQTLTVRPNTTSLPSGQHTAVLTFTPTSELPPVQVAVVYTVSTLSLSVAPSQLSFTAFSNQSALPTAQTVNLTSNGQALGYWVNVSYSGGAWEWLSLPSSGVTPRSFNLRPNTTALSPGQYTAVVSFIPDNGQSSVQLTVTYTVKQQSLAVSPTQLSFTASSGQSALPTAQSVNVTGEPGKSVNYSVSASYSGSAGDWLTLPASGATPQTLTVRPNTTALSAGQYTAVVSFTADNGQPPVQLTVTYTVSAPPLSVAPTQLSFTAFTNQSALPTAQSVTISAQQGQAVNYWVNVSYSGSAWDWLTLPSSGVTPRLLDLRPNTTALSPGQYTAVVSFIPDNGQPSGQLTVTYTVKAQSLAVSPTQLSFTASSGQGTLPAAQSVNATGEPGQAIHYALSASYSGGAADWLTLPTSGVTPQTHDLRPNTTALPPGKYTAVVSFTADTGQPPVQLTVVYTLTAAELRINPSAPVLRVDASTQEAALTSLATVTSTGAPLDWRVVSVGVDWLDITPTSGDTQSQSGLNLVVRKSALSTLDNGTYSGTVTLAYGNASTPERQLNLSVKLSLALPQVRIVTPYWIEAGRSLSHILRGEGFSNLQSGQSVRFGTTTTSTFEVISDAELRLTVPALSAGTHPVLVDNALGLSRPGPNLYAVQTAAMPEFSMARTRRANRVIYDPRRAAIYSVDYSTSTGVAIGLYRYRHVNGTWTEEPYVTLPDTYDAVMDADGQSLSMAIGNGLYRLDLDDPTATPQYLRPNIGRYNQLEFLNDGYMLNTGDSCYHMVVSLDGRRAIVMDAGCYSPANPVRTRDAGSTEFQSTRLWDMYGPQTYMSVDRTARYAVIGNSVYNAQWSVVADVTDLQGTLFSQDARRLFAFYADHNQSRQLMRVFDVSKPPIGGRFTQLTELVVNGAQPGDGIYGLGRIIITPDDRTLIHVNQRRFYVMPLPASVQ